MCVADQYVFVIDSGLHNVSVFTTEMIYVSSFDLCGSEEGYLIMSTRALCVDTDDFVYAADFQNTNVQVF